MITVFSDWASANLGSTFTTGTYTGQSLKLTIFVRAPEFDDYTDATTRLQFPNMASHIRGCDTLTELLALDGWQVAGDNQENDGIDDLTGSNIQVSSAGGIIQLFDSNRADFTYYSVEPIFAVAFALSVSGGANDGKLICVFRTEQPLFMSGDSADICSLVAGSSSEAGTGSWVSYSTDTSFCDPQLGTIGISVPVTEWEGSRAAHIWMDAQRVNCVVNSSFEINNFGWRSNGTMARVAGGIPRSPRQYCGQVSGNVATKVLESLPFPTKFSNGWWSLEASVSGTGRARIGLVVWPLDMNPDDIEYLCGEWVDITASSPTTAPVQGEFKTLKALLPAPETTHEAQFRIEFEGTAATNYLWVDDVLVDPNEAQLGYFDGGWDYGQHGDFSWYGKGKFTAGTTNADHKTYSLFYNNRENLQRLLFGYAETVNSESVHHKGMAESWVPEGVFLIPHWDDVFSIKTHSWFEDIYIPILDFTTKNVVNTIP